MRNRTLIPKISREYRQNSGEIYLRMMETILRTNTHLSEDSNTVLGLIRGQNWVRLLEYADSLSVHEYSDRAQHYAKSQLVALIKKYPFSGDIDSRTPALEKFFKAEERCAEYNTKFRDPLWQRNICYGASKWIKYVLGGSPNLGQVFDQCDFGPGASIGIAGNDTTFARKLSSERITVTPSAVPYVLAGLYHNHQVREYFLSENPGEIYSHDFELFSARLMPLFDTVTYNKVITVPKTTLTDRVIAVEPLGNVYVQKGVDNLMRNRLKRVGIDLRYQEPNQLLSRVGSFDGSFATIDLSSASDSISKEVVKRLVPPAWYDLFLQLRSPSYSLDNKTPVTYEKLSSMGNGFTFPLETLIFASLIKAIRPQYKPRVDFLVYGDDIVIRTEAARELLNVLSNFGFLPNTSKTFIQGPFRESCGADWFRGMDVRPIQLDYALNSVTSIIKFHNLIRRNLLWRNFFGDEFLKYLRETVPAEMRLVCFTSSTPEGAFETCQDEVLSSKFTRYLRSEMRWVCLEFKTVPVASRTFYKKRYLLDWIAMLRGSPSGQLHVLRRLTRTRVANT